MTLLERGHDGFSTIKTAWTGDPVVCIGGGPSLTLAQVEMVRGRARVIAVNDAYLLAPWAEVCFFADAEWWTWHCERGEFIAFTGQKCTINPSGLHIRDAAVHRLKNAGREGLSLDPAAVITGGNSGFQALNIAILSGAKVVILIGYDAREPKGGEASHWFGEHPRRAPITVFRSYRDSFRAADLAIKAAGVRVINCSPGSAIETFEKMPLDEALECHALSV